MQSKKKLLNIHRFFQRPVVGELLTEEFAKQIHSCTIYRNGRSVTDLTSHKQMACYGTARFPSLYVYDSELEMNDWMDKKSMYSEIYKRK